MNLKSWVCSQITNIFHRPGWNLEMGGGGGHLEGMPD